MGPTGRNSHLRADARKWHCRRDFVLNGCFAFLSMFMLAGCVDSFVSAQAPQAPALEPSNIARRPGVSPSGTTVAVASFKGGPDALRAHFMSDFDAAAREQQIIMATPDAADYLVRGYLSATTEGNQTAVTYVIDIFDAKKQRTERIEDEVLINGAAPDPWSVVDDNALAAVAAKSAAGLAAVLTNTPQAISAASQNGNAAPDPTAQTEPPDRTVVAASPGAGPPGIPGLPH
jgi:hypothetical protein